MTYPNWILESVDGDFAPCTLSDFIDANRETFSANEIRTISCLRPGETLSGGGGGWGEWTIRRQAKGLKRNGLSPAWMVALAVAAAGGIYFATRGASGSTPTDARASGSTPTDARAEYSAALREFASAKGAHAAALLRTIDHPQDTALREAYNATVVRFAAATARIEAARARIGISA